MKRGNYVLSENRKKSKKKKSKGAFFSNPKNVVVTAVLALVLLFAVVFTVVYIAASDSDIGKTELSSDSGYLQTVDNEQNGMTDKADSVITDNQIFQNTETTTAKASAETTASVPNTTKASTGSSLPEGTLISYPSDTAAWKMICLNKNRYVDSSYESGLNLSYVAGSGEQMDSRAAAAYEEMYSAALSDGIRLTPCSGYRSYSTQKRLYYEFYDEYIAQGYSSSEAHRLTSRRRNPPGSSEHNIGICMDIICAASSANFQNTKEYAWLMSNAHNYGFILRYPEDKESITGVKFEPWHWRFVGKENASAIKNSGLCLEEYLGFA